MTPRKFVAELVGTALLVFFAVGVATLSFGFGFTGESVAAGVVATALAFGLVLLALAYAIGSISGCHINPAVTIGFVASGRMSIVEAVGYWIAQVIGGIVGAALLFATVSMGDGYDRDKMGLGADGYGDASMAGLNAGGAFLAEVILTFLFVLVVLTVTREAAAPHVGGIALGLALTVVHLVGIPLTGTSVNPARSIGPALFAGGDALPQLWLFIVAPLVGGIIAGLFSIYLFPKREHDTPEEATAHAA